MKIYVREEDKKSFIPGIIATIVFLSYSIGVFFYTFKNCESFINMLTSFGIVITSALVFFGFGIYSFYSLIKKPVPFKSKLISKKIEIYNGKQITYMKFSVPKEEKLEENFISSDYYCYTLGENALIVGNNYLLEIKEFNWEVTGVEEINACYKKNIKDKIPNMALSPVFFGIGLISAGLLLSAILGIIINPAYATGYILPAIISAIFVFGIFKAHKAWKLDNNIDSHKQDLNLKFKKIKPINNSQEEVGNIAIRNLFIWLIIFSILWFILISNINIEKVSFMTVCFFIFFIESPIIIMIFYNIGLDDRLIKKHKLNIKENINFFNLNYFNIFRANQNTLSPQYFIVDQDKNLILKIKNTSFFGNNFAICNPYNIKIGEIRQSLFSVTNEFFINIINEEPFMIRSKLLLHSNYQIIGRNYYAKGDTQLINNIIFDNNDNDVAYISAVSKHNNNWYELGNTNVLLNNINNNIDIMIIASCITMGNFKTASMRMK